MEYFIGIVTRVKIETELEEDAIKEAKKWL